MRLSARHPMVLGVSAALAGLGALVLFAAAGRHPGQGYGAAGLLLGLVAVAAVTAAVVRPTRVRRRRAATAAGTAVAGVRSAGSGHEDLATGGVLLALATLVVFLGALSVRGGIVFGLIVVAAVFVPLEKVFALHPQKVLRRGWATDAVHLVVNNLLSTAGMLLAVVAAGTGLRAIVGAGLRASVARQPGGLQICEALVLSGLGAYWGHRAAHTVPLLWRFHKVHHSIQEMDWLAAGRLHPIDQAFTRSCAVLPLYALGFSRATFGAFLVFTTFQALFIHANVRLRFGPLRWIIATPEFHHWHHANEPEAYNSNFAGEFPWIDWLFGTLRLPAGRMPARYGIDDPLPSGYLRQLAWPFRRRRSGGRLPDRAAGS